MGNPELNFKLQEIEDLNIKERDIFYKEGIIEFLESDKDIDIIFGSMPRPSGRESSSPSC